MGTSANATQKYFAQFGEDRILDAIFQHQREGNCVEVGANDGITDSMTYHFELMGWECLLVEPVPDLARKISEKRNCIVKTYAASSIEGEASFTIAEKALGMSGLGLSKDQRKKITRAGGTPKETTVRKKTLDSILEESNFSRIDFISIDVEGHELEVLKGFSLENFQPRIVLIEDNQDQTDPAVQDHMKSKGYVLFRRTGVNDWYALLNDRELVNPERLAALPEERARARTDVQIMTLENAIARKFSFVLPYIPEWTKSIVKRLIRLISNVNDGINKKMEVDHHRRNPG